jgi:hypothetical protein
MRIKIEKPYIFSNGWEFSALLTDKLVFLVGGNKFYPRVLIYREGDTILVQTNNRERLITKP